MRVNGGTMDPNLQLLSAGLISAKVHLAKSKEDVAKFKAIKETNDVQFLLEHAKRQVRVHEDLIDILEEKLGLRKK
jgi:hypothetical protein